MAERVTRFDSGRQGPVQESEMSSVSDRERVSDPHSWRRWQAKGAPAQRVDYWKDVVCEAVLDVVMTPCQSVAGQPFHGSISSRDQGGARFVNFRSDAHRIQRTEGQVDQSNGGFLMVSLQTQGRSRLMQRRGEVDLKAGDIGILDSTRPFQIDFPETVERRILMLPRNLLEARLPAIRHWQGPQRMAAGEGLAKIVGQTLKVLTARNNSLGEPTVQALLGSVADLLAARFSEATSVPTATQSLLAYRGACQYIENRLRDPDLTPAEVARHVGLSLRTLQRLFQRQGNEGMGVEGYIVEQRLARAYRLLQTGATRTVSEAAFVAGFSDLSHFTRRFQARYDIKPSALLKRAALDSLSTPRHL